MMDDKRPRKHPARGPFASIRRFLDSLFGNKIFLRVFSVLFAITVWCFFVAADGTLTRQKTFAHIPVSVTGESALLSRGYVVTSKFAEVIPYVDFVTEVTQANYERASASAYNPHLELSQVTGEGENELTVVFTSQIYGQVVSCNPASVKVQVERYITRRVPVVVMPEGQMEEELYLLSYEADPATLVVSGPQSVVSRVARIAVRLNLSQLSAERMSDRMSLGFELQDADGQAVVSDRVNVTNQSVVQSAVMVDVVLVPQKQVAIDEDGLVTGEPAEGYELSDAWAAEEHLTVAADREVLDALEVISVEEPLDITGEKGTVRGIVRLKTPAGIRNRIPSQMAVTAVLQEKTLERTFRSVPITAEGATDERQVTLSPNRTAALLSGAYGFISGLGTDDIQLYVDVSDLEEGRHTVPVRVRIDNASDFSCALGATEVTVTIREK